MQREASDIKGRWYYTEYTETKYGARDLFPGVKGIALADSTLVTSLRHEKESCQSGKTHIPRQTKV